MFDEVAFRLEFGCKILAGHLVACRFGQNRAQSIVAISQTLDKLVVHKCTLACEANSNLKLFNSDNEVNQEAGGFIKSAAENKMNSQCSSMASPSVFYIAIKDVIRSISVHTLRAFFSLEARNKMRVNECTAKQTTSETTHQPTSSTFTSTSTFSSLMVPVEERHHDQMIYNNNSKSFILKDLLLIGCSKSLIVYDATNQCTIANISTVTSIDAIANSSLLFQHENLNNNNNNTNATTGATGITRVTNSLAICGGAYKIYAIKFEMLSQIGLLQNSNAELSSERSTGDTVTSLIQGTFNGLDLVLSGSVEQKIRAYQLDSFDLNIQTCKLTIEENAQVNCLCPINTISSEKFPDEHVAVESASVSNTLPSFTNEAAHSQLTSSVDDNLREEMSYFAYGLESGFVGVYQLFHCQESSTLTRKLSSLEKKSITLASERVWRHKCKYTPLTIIMYDINGDGLDELVVGFKNSRIEARSPFTGQLLAATRCFKSEKLAALQVVDYNNDGSLTLLACSTNGTINAFKPITCKSRIPLRGYSLQVQQQQDLNVLLDETSQMLLNQQQLPISTNFQIFEEEQTSSVSGGMIGVNDLHIESHCDNQKPSKCDAKQSHDLLLKVNALYTEQMNLERKACQDYHKNVYQAPRYYSSNLSLEHRWDFDSTSLCFRLTIVIIGTKADDIKLVKLKDESKNCISRDYLLVNPKLTNADAGKTESTTEAIKSHVVVIPLRFEKDIETKLELKVFCESTIETHEDPNVENNKAKNYKFRLDCIYSKSIDVPKFSMITFAPTLDKGVEATQEGEERTMIKLVIKLKGRLEANQVLEWLKENFLCFRFGQLIKSNDSSKLQRHSKDTKTAHLNLSTTSYPSRSAATTNCLQENLILDNNGRFELNLLDVRHTLNRSANLFRNNTPDLVFDQTKLINSGSMLRIAYSGDHAGKEVGVENASSSSSFKNRTLTLECENFDLAVDLVQSLVIDRLQLESSLNEERKLNRKDGFEANVKPILDELSRVTEISRQLEESENRIQSELYEAIDYTKILMQQFVIANELNEFNTSKELLNELFMILNGAQNAARAHNLNNRSRVELSKQANELKSKINFLTGEN